MAKNRTADAGMLNISFETPEGVGLEKNQIVEIVDDLTVNKPQSDGSTKVIGICAFGNSSDSTEKVVVHTKGRLLRTKESAGTVAVGPVVTESESDRVKAYDSNSHDSAAIIGWALETAGQAGVDILILLK